MRGTSQLEIAEIVGNRPLLDLFGVARVSVWATLLGRLERRSIPLPIRPDPGVNGPAVMLRGEHRLIPITRGATRV